MVAPSFKVDTQIFRELGAMLVGRESTALSELVKNAYDADATVVSVYGENLSESSGFIRIEDDGHGMDPVDFAKGFLTIASRAKANSSRYSPLFHRRLTGAKGIGRLAAHKLASVIEIESRPHRKIGKVGVRARIDWDAIEELATLDDIAGSDALVIDEFRVGRAPHGTTITLRGLRSQWSDSALQRFVAEVQSYEAPRVLTRSLPSDQLVGESLLGYPHIRNTEDSSEHSFSVELEGAFEPGDEFWDALLANSTWVLEIDSSPAQVHYRALPTRGGMEKSPTATPLDIEVDAVPDAPVFQSRILVREGAARGSLAKWLPAASGIRVYMEGFRVLPYGERGNDWLRLDADYASRSDVLSSQLLRELVAEDDAGDPGSSRRNRVGLMRLPSRAYVGGVFLTEKNAPSLQMLVNREGFLPNVAFERIEDIVRGGLELLTRHRSALTFAKRSGTSDGTSVTAPADGLEEARSLTKKLVRAAAKDQMKLVRTTEARLFTALDRADAAIEAARSLRQDVLVLASVGLQMASFTHELTGIVTHARASEISLRELRETEDLSVSVRRAVSRRASELLELRLSLERQAAYLVDVASVDARRRRSRQRLRDVVDSALRLVQTPLKDQGIDVRISIAADMRTPPMFRSELVTILTNLLTNAIKATGEEGRITIRGRERRPGVLSVLVANTGFAVDLEESERWFAPYESTTAAIDSVLGQGMGLGLTITRSLVEERGGIVRFVRAPKSYATAVEVTFGVGG